jgi:micrococcal nuclease
MQTGLIRVVLPALLLLFAACEAPEATSEEEPRLAGEAFQAARVVRVVDGDTLIVEIDGREERLRYIGVDAPESVTPDAPVECFGPEAAGENRRLVEGRAVLLEPDTEDRDRFGRLLRYVFVVEADDSLSFVNLMLVERGFAEAGTFPPNERHADELFAAEREARSAWLGLWDACRKSE